MKKWLLAILFGTVLTLGACGGGDDTNNGANNGDNGGNVETSAADDVYKNSCAACHGGDLSGGAGPDLSAIGSKYSAEDIEDIIENGIGTMQPQRGVSDDDRALLAGWLADKK